MTDIASLDELGKEIRDRIASADSNVDITSDCLADAGRMLLEVKLRIAETRETTFKAFLEQNSIGRSRAFELVAIAEGKKTIVGMRAANAERQAKHRETNRVAKESVSNGLPDPDPETKDLMSAWVNADEEEREAFLRKISRDISDWYVPKHWYDDAAFELHIARGTPVPDALARKYWHRLENLASQ